MGKEESFIKVIKSNSKTIIKFKHKIYVRWNKKNKGCEQYFSKIILTKHQAQFNNRSSKYIKIEKFKQFLIKNNQNVKFKFIKKQNQTKIFFLIKKVEYFNKNFMK